eukprot:TRINITY_DN3989_c0_g3_i1.p1 TRINITY_DN3989_c0_g3~~TRINITY_DN3989_c0_g3_i1.p1  ORF type:complete len:504 (-),score=46.41 TRINITY_DN3989_c0_g3_i1:605-2023(-)
MAPQERALFRAVRHGDLERVKYLIEIQGEAAHQFDEWEATPLYYAALCGHVQIIEYLLASGARCDEKTFDGERCFYVALNNNIRKLLKDEGFKKGAARGHDLYLDFIQHLLNNQDSFPDVILTAREKQLQCHRCILHIRCPGLLQALSLNSCPSGQRDPIHLDVSEISIPWHVLSALIKWCYTGRLEVSMDSADYVVNFLRQINAYKLANQLKQCEDATPGVLGTVVVEPDRDDVKQQIQRDMGALFKQGWQHDLELIVEGGSVLFEAHKAIMCVRSQYFAALVNSPLADYDENGVTSVNLKDIGERVIFQMLCWAYTDSMPERQDGQLLLQVLKVADRFLVDGLKQCCTLLLTPFINGTNAIPLLQEGMAMNNERLMDICCRFIAQNLIQVVKDPLFRRLVCDSASTIVGRQEVDSLPIIDDIRYHIDHIHADDVSDSEDEDEDDIVIQPSQRQLKLMALDEMLFELGIEA